MKIYNICPECRGAGVSDPNSSGATNNCGRCEGTGRQYIGNADDIEIIDELDTIKKRLKKIMDKLEIV